jgi:hypothetical protein
VVGTNYYYYSIKTIKVQPSFLLETVLPILDLLLVLASTENGAEQEDAEDETEVFVTIHFELSWTDFALSEEKGRTDAPPIETC